MRKIQFYVLLFVSLMIMTIGLIACTNDEAITDNANEKTSTFSRKSEEGYTYAKDFYQSNISFGKSITISNNETSEKIIIQELLVNNEKTARGYIVKDSKSGSFLFFADVNREKDILTVYDAKMNTNEIFSNLSKNEDYKITQKFDFIKYANQKVTTAKGCGFWQKVWGSCSFTVTKPVSGSPGWCVDYTSRNKYFLGFIIDATGPIPGGVYRC